MRLLLALCFLLASCAAPMAAVPGPRTEPAPQATPAAAPGASQSAAKPTANPLRAVPPPPAECAAYARATSDGRACPTELLAALNQALAAVDPAERDGNLAGLESCAGLEVGLVRALRAEFAPTECADLIVKDAVAELGSRMTPAMHDALAGLAIGARLLRLVRSPPTPAAPHTKDSIDAFIKGGMAEWVTAQADAIGALAREGSRLTGYGKGIAAIEAGMADMRFVEAFRSVPVPDEIAGDVQLRDAYYSALDQALEPRKDRGRDAALVGLKMLASVGALRDARIDRARALLSKLYNGRRIDALDGLLLPALPKLEQRTPEERLVARLPTFYADSVLASSHPPSASLLRALIEQGLPAGVRAKLERESPRPELRLLYARALFELGRTYWRAAEFGRARALAAAESPGQPDAKLVAALGAALERGPKDAAAMMLSGPMPQGTGNVSLLDALAQSGGAMGGMAAFDAALIRELVPPQDRRPDFFADLAARYTKAATLLTDPNHKRVARERAGTATVTAKALR